jgi:transcriptional regulator with XRE-family HTH domain
MSNGRGAQANVLNRSRSGTLERKRVRARLLLAGGITLCQVADAAGVNQGFVSHVLAGSRSATTPAGQRVRAAAESLSGMTWAELTAPLARRKAA